MSSCVAQDKGGSMRFVSLRQQTDDMPSKRKTRWRISSLVVALAAFGVLLLFLSARPALADDPRFGTRRTFGTGADYFGNLVMGDINGDGALDLVASNYGKDFSGGQSAVFLNDDSGNFFTGSIDCSDRLHV